LPAFQQKNVAAFETAVGPEFDKVKAAPRLVVDLRGNSGGSLNSALDFVAQLPSAKQTDYCEFFDRTPSSEPPAYTSAGRRAVAPGSVPPAKRFAYSGRVALLVDGATFSAAEHFVLAARTAATVTIIGTKTAGSYGNTTNDVPKMLAGDPALQVVVNRSQVRGLDGKPLDGVSQEPDVVVEYEPSAIAAGKDPMMLRAVTELSK
jgi:C-terminal processing protease CtpA/Prc